MSLLTQILFSVRLEKIPFTEGILIALMGILIVFVVLLVLVGILVAFGKVFNFKIFNGGLKKKKAVEVKDEIVEEDDGETMAAIIAAITIMMANEPDSENEVKPKFVIKNLKRLK